MPHTETSAVRPDQATQLRELARRRGRSKLTVAITSGKGGVGKSNVAVNLSIFLAAKRIRVTLADLDMGLANADLLMNLHPRYTLAHVLAGVRTIEDICMEGPGGIRFVPGASGTRGVADLSEFERQNLLVQLRKLHSNTDMVIFDCGAGVSRNVTTFAQAADLVMVVTTPEPTALTDAYATIKTLRRDQCAAKVSLFVNMADNRAEAKATYRRVAGVARKFLNYFVADAGYMLHDTAVERAVQARCPFVVRYPESNASACIAAMANELARRFPATQRRGGFLHRVAGLFV